MKKSALILSGLFIGLLTMVGCQKEDFNDLSGPTGTASENTTLAKKGREGKGAVYTMDNAAGGNNIIAFNRDKDGMLSPGGTIPTGGNGSGGGLGSQGAIVLDGNYLYACNAGSNEISVFKMFGSGLSLIDKVPSHGMKPISLTVHGNTIYVLNAGGTGNISGFRMMHDQLQHIANSDKPLSSSTAGGAQIQFDKTGKQLVVTEKMTDKIVVYDVNHGVASNGVAHPSVGATPFGFDFGKNNTLIVSDAFGGSPNASALTSYTLSNQGNLSLITGPVATHQTAACWVVATKDGKYCYATNTGSNNISGYEIDHTGAITLLDMSGNTAPTGDHPIDAIMSKNSTYLYALNAGDHTVSMYRSNQDGSLSPLGSVSVPSGSVGLAAE